MIYVISKIFLKVFFVLNLLKLPQSKIAIPQAFFKNFINNPKEIKIAHPLFNLKNNDRCFLKLLASPKNIGFEAGL